MITEYEVADQIREAMRDAGMDVRLGDEHEVMEATVLFVVTGEGQRFRIDIAETD